MTWILEESLFHTPTKKSKTTEDDDDGFQSDRSGQYEKSPIPNTKKNTPPPKNNTTPGKSPNNIGKNLVFFSLFFLVGESPRKRKPNWEEKETNNLIRGIAKYGRGHFDEIMQSFEFDDRRTEADLKCKKNFRSF